MYLYNKQGQGSTESKIVFHGLVMVPFGLLVADRWAAPTHLQLVTTSLVYRSLVLASVVLLIAHSNMQFPRLKECSEVKD